ncbi:hypothetical protein [Mesorhizobium sp. Root695]|jgi:hypothetical protein|nr:hypothetical protein [Mesorhizobium sp. Root695]
MAESLPPRGVARQSPSSRYSSVGMYSYVNRMPLQPGPVTG